MAKHTFHQASAVPLTPYKDNFDTSEYDTDAIPKDNISGDPEAAGLRRRTNHAQPLGRVVNSLLIVFFCFIGVYGLVKVVECYQDVTTVTPGSAKVYWRLDIPQHYPPLTQDGSAENSMVCQAAWDSLSSINCHENIFIQDWDNATDELVRSMTELCRPGCQKDLAEATELITRECSAAVFDTKNYNGTVSANTLERGPAEALQNLLQRNSHTCRPSDHSGYKYCTEEMIQRWGVYDAMNHTTLEGLSSFLDRVVGRDRDRDCGSCTLGWLENILNAWEPSQVLSPDTHVPISLPEHLRRVEQAGQKCEKESWDKIWNDAIRKYTKEGKLTADWRTLPSGDYGWTVKNGLVSPGDGPRPAIHDALESILAQGHSPPKSSKGDAYSCLMALENQVTGLPCDIYLNKSQLDSILEPGNQLFNSFCRQECTDWIVRHQDNLESCRSKKMDKNAIAGPLFTAYEEAEEKRRNICRKPADDTTFCAPIFANLHHPEWVSNKRLTISSLEPMLGELERVPIPRTVAPAVGRRVPSPSPDSGVAWSHIVAAHEAIRTGICSRCVWEMVVGNGTISSAKHSLQDVDDVDAYLGFADRLYNACASRGADWLGGLPYGGDDAIWRVKDVDGSVSRLIVDKPSSPFQDEKWLQAYEDKNLVTVHRFTFGTIWHLRAAGRQIKAERQGNLTKFLAEESKHRQEEDAKVWRHSENSFRSWEWIKPEDRQ